ncbi:AtuA-related protein [Streptomyces sp. NPDC055210]
MLLHALAHARSGDKGNVSDITVIAYEARDFPLLREAVTTERVRRHFSAFLERGEGEESGEGDVRRYELPHLGALKFVLEGALDGGVTRSLNLDTHGKCLASLLLGMDIGDDHAPEPEPKPEPELEPELNPDSPERSEWSEWSGIRTSHGTRR